MRTGRNDYDLIVSLGGNCGVAAQTKHRGLRYCSLPLDWAIMANEKPLKQLPELLAAGFADFCRYENMYEYCPAVKERGVAMCQLEDRYSGYRMMHSFPAPLADREKYEKSRSVLKRRIERLYRLVAKAKNVLFVLSTGFEFDAGLLDDIYAALVKTFPGVEVELANMQFSARQSEEFDVLGGHGRVMRIERAFNNIYDVRFTAPEWEWMDALQITGAVDRYAMRKRNWKLKYAYKLWSSLGKYLERNTTGCANMRF